ncbi:MAG: chorismate mutase [Oscillospiraceae bacterium]|jgi:chorismate mutase/prephenate dehydratase|nr:chorismate mutase [Oscillospiraceae bacterium]
MTPTEELAALRGKIDAIDEGMLKLFRERQEVSAGIADVKERGNIAVTDPVREQLVIARARASAEPEVQSETAAFMRTLVSLSKKRQTQLLGLYSALDFPPSTGAPDGPAAFQGVAGAWSEHAAIKMFPDRELTNCEYFEDVFNAVKTGRAAYGVLPIENSRTGAIGEVYDLLRRHSCYVVGQTWVPVRQCLIGLATAGIGDIREVFSHPEGFSQSTRFLKNKNWELTDVRNTAVAAKIVAERGEAKYAAIGSRRAAEVYGLGVLADSVSDDPKNRTRFIAIAAQPQYDETSDIVTVTFSTAHHAGALCDTLSAFQLAGINLTRIESRPAAQAKYRFFADLDASITDGLTREALAQAAAQSDYFEILGCYSELAAENA